MVASSHREASSFEEGHHNLLCHPRSGHHSKSVITTCCVIHEVVLPQNNLRPRVPFRRGNEECLWSHIEANRLIRSKG